MGGHCAIGERAAVARARALRLSREQSQQLAFLVRHHMRIADFPRMGRGKQVRFVTTDERPGEPGWERRYPRFFELLQLLIADCEASAHKASGWAPILEETIRVALHIEEVGTLARARELIDGHTLIQLGVSPGPRLGALLAALHDRVLAGEITTREDARAAALEMLAKDGDRT